MSVGAVSTNLRASHFPINGNHARNVKSPGGHGDAVLTTPRGCHDILHGLGLYEAERLVLDYDFALCSFAGRVDDLSSRHLD